MLPVCGQMRRLCRSCKHCPVCSRCWQVKAASSIGWCATQGKRGHGQEQGQGRQGPGFITAVQNVAMPGTWARVFFLPQVQLEAGHSFGLGNGRPCMVTM